MANVKNPYGFVLHSVPSGGAGAPIETVTTTSNTSFKIGDPIRISTTGLAVKSTAASTAAGYIYGFALEPITAKAATTYSMKIVPALPNYIFRATAGSTLNVTKGYLGRNAGVWASGVYFAINPGAPTLSQLRIVGKLSTDSWATYVQLLCVVKHSQYVGQIT